MKYTLSKVTNTLYAEWLLSHHISCHCLSRLLLSENPLKAACRDVQQHWCCTNAVCHVENTGSVLLGKTRYVLNLCYILYIHFFFFKRQECSGCVEVSRLAGVRWQSLSITAEPLIAFHPLRFCNFSDDAQRLMQRVGDWTLTLKSYIIPYIM